MRNTTAAVISVGEAARRLGVSPETIRNYIMRGIINEEDVARLPGRQGHRRISVSAIQKLLKVKKGAKDG